MSHLTLALCALAAAGLLAVGVLALLSPIRLARSYGVVAKDVSALAYVRATGARDTVLGAVFAFCVYRADVPVLLALSVAGLLLSLADFAIAFLAAKKTIRSEHGAHIGGAIGFIVLIVLLAQT